MVTLATLYLRDPLVKTSVITSGIENTAPCDASLLRDGADATLYSMGMNGDGVVTGIGAIRAYGRLGDFALASGATISQITVRVRARTTASGGGTCGLIITFDDDGIGEAAPSQAPDDIESWLEYVLTVDTNALPWVAGRISGRLLGWKAVLNSVGVDDSVACDVLEYQVLVEGTAAPTTTYASVPQDAQSQSSYGVSPVTVLDGYKVSPTPLPGYVTIPQPNPGGYVLKPYPTGGYAAVKSAADANASLAVIAPASHGDSTDPASRGAQNLCAVQNQVGAWNLGGLSIEVLVALHSLPVQKNSADEIHAFLTFFIPGAGDIVRFGVTPSGRIGARIVGLVGAVVTDVTLLSSLGAANADGVFRNYVLRGGQFPDGVDSGTNLGPKISVDGSQVVHVGHGVIVPDIASNPDQRLMLFNSPDGLTRMDHSIAHLLIQPLGALDPDVRYEMNEGSGVTIRLSTAVDAGGGDVKPQYFSTHDLTIRALVDGEFGQSLVWGSQSSGTIGWSRRPGFTKRLPISPTYRPLSGGSQA